MKIARQLAKLLRVPQEDLALLALVELSDGLR